MLGKVTKFQLFTSNRKRLWPYEMASDTLCPSPGVNRVKEEGRP